MVKIVYTGPGNHHLRMGMTSKVYSFVPENNYTQDVEWDVVYQAIREPRAGEYIRIEWDPKAIPRQKYKNPSVMSLGDMKPVAQKNETIIENPDGTDTTIDTDSITDDVLGIKPDDIEDLWAWIPDTKESINEDTTQDTPSVTDIPEHDTPEIQETTDQSIPEAGPSTIVVEAQTEVETKSNLS